EVFRAIRTNLQYFTGAKDRVVFVITSSISNEGKSFTTINMRTVLAFSGKRTLILGADMRKPKIFGDYGLENSVGLSKYLTGLARSCAVVVSTTGLENQDVVSCGTAPYNPSELLLSPRMEIFNRESLYRYDYELLDTPPLAIVTDAF